MTDLEKDRVLIVLSIPYEDITGVSQNHPFYRWQIYFESLNPTVESILKITESDTIDIWFSEDRIPVQAAPEAHYYENRRRPYSLYTSKIFSGYRLPPIRTTFCGIIPGTKYIGLFLHG